jgi:thiol-disulfide isomerase/thioredoxin
MVFVALYAWMTRGNASPLMGEPAPDLTLAIAAGAQPGSPTKVTLSDMGGQVVVLDFWASWCGACRRAVPILNDLNDEFAGKGVAFYAVNVEPIDRQRTRGLRDRVSDPSRPGRNGSKAIRHQVAAHRDGGGPRWRRSLGVYGSSQQNQASRGDFRSPELARIGRG